MHSDECEKTSEDSARGSVWRNQDETQREGECMQGLSGARVRDGTFLKSMGGWTEGRKAQRGVDRRGEHAVGSQAEWD